MTDGLLPPYGEPVGDRADDTRVLEVFIRDEPALVHSALLHLEGATLVAGGDMSVAMRIAPHTFLLRRDLPPDVEAANRALAQALGAAGHTCLDEESPLATAVAIQVLGLRTATWDLWGADIDEAFTELRATASGEWDGLFPQGPPSVPGPGPLD
ncbi:MAG: hypothetical protein ACR2MO_11495 [Acidimicrobiales bacterium]